MLKRILAFGVVLMVFGAIVIFNSTEKNVAQAAEGRCIPTDGPIIYRSTVAQWSRAGAPGEAGHNINVFYISRNGHVTNRGWAMIGGWRNVTQSGVHGWVPNNTLATVSC